ncbi:MAG: MgtC/SapB family protein [Cyanobacteria bacterium SZAS TMP-1]|nr:MgtC/SapB family protein [Cyanobacteria bacterium SZAS TMP-1]
MFDLNTINSMPDISSMVPDWLNKWFGDLQVAPHFLHTQAYLPPLLVAMFLGYLIGFERRLRHKVAGVRTHMVVAAASCIVTMIGLYVFDATKIGDASRLPGQILTGITFLGAGVIMKRGFSTSGITTAAMVLLSTAIGIACGFGFILMAVTCTVLIVTAVHITYYTNPPDDTGEHLLLVSCPLEKYENVRKLFPARSHIDQFTRDANNVVSVRINVKMNRGELDKVLSTNVHNQDIIAIKLIDDPAS